MAGLEEWTGPIEPDNDDEQKGPKPQDSIKILDYVKSETFRPPWGGQTLINTAPCSGAMYVPDSKQYFIHGRLAVKGNDEGRYPEHYLDFIDRVFGPEPNTIEVCSRTVKVDSMRTRATVDLDPEGRFKPTYQTDGQILAGVPSRAFKRWRSDPPYNEKTAAKMYGTDLPNPKRLLEAGARVIEKGSLMFLLLGPQNYQQCPEGVVRVGLIYISVIPNNETRALNIYMKVADVDEPAGYQGQLM